MTIQPRSSKVRRLGLILPLSLCKARTSSWWLLVILPCVRWWSAANQRRIRCCSCESRTAGIPTPFSTRAVCETGDRHVEGRQRLLVDSRERAGQLTAVAELHDDHPRKLRDHHEGGRRLRRFLIPPGQG